MGKREDRRQEECAYGVYMRDRIERKPSRQPRRRITQPIGHVAVRHFVENNRENKDNNPKNDVWLHILRTNGTMRERMAKTCPITHKSSQVGGGYSNRVRATKFNPTGKVRKHANMQKKRVFVPELGRTFTLTLSTKGIKTISKNGAYKTLKAAGII